jgi:predicted small metal-binding protein
MDDDRPVASGEAPPVKTVQCSCGYVASGETADELLDDVEAHIDAEHGRTRPSEELQASATADDLSGTVTTRTEER